MTRPRPPSCSVEQLGFTLSTAHPTAPVLPPLATAESSPPTECGRKAQKSVWGAEQVGTRNLSCVHIRVCLCVLMRLSVCAVSACA